MARLTEEQKLHIIDLDKAGLSGRKIEKEVGVPRSTIGDFLRRESYQSWWEDYDSNIEVVSNSEEEEYTERQLEDLCNDPDWHVANLAKRLRTAQKTNTQLRRINNQVVDVEDHFPEVIKAVKEAAISINQREKIETAYTPSNTAQDCIMEILFSDLQIGKVGQYYNSERALCSLKYFGKILVELINERNDKYNLNKIILASLGDIVEDHMKHGVQSATSTDKGLAEQMALAITEIWASVLQPLASLKIPMEVVCVAGNHGSSQHKGMDMFKAGLFSYDYPIYKALEGFCHASGYDHVKFIIPEGHFGYTTIFGRSVVYEHGYGHNCTEKALEDHRAKRSAQMKRHVEYYRCGDMHHICNYDCGKLVVNGAFFGTDTEGQEYSGILGFNAVPAQVVMFHTETDSVGRNTVNEFLQIQVAKGY